MSNSVQAACDTCGPVDLPPNEVAISLCTNRQSLTRYTFVYPKCHALNGKKLAQTTAHAFEAAGIPTQRWAVPAEALEEHRGPVFTYDDLLDFALLDISVADFGVTA